MATDTGERTLVGPERAGGQGLAHNQEESGNRAIALLLPPHVVSARTQLVDPPT